MSIRQWTFLSSAGLVLVTLAVYSLSLRGQFVYDDHWAIERNMAMEHAPLWLFWADPETGADPRSGLTKDIYRPLTAFSFALSTRLWKRHLALWHCENLAWHLINGILFSFLLRRLGLPWGAGLLFAVAVFLLNPLQVSSVAWIYQRSTLLSTAGCLAALLLALKDGLPTPGRFIGSLFFFIAALFSKESAVMLPGLFWVISNSMHRLYRRWCLIGFSLCGAGFLALRGWLLGGWSQISDLPRSGVEKMILTFIAVPQYLAKFIVPLGLRASYDLPSFTTGRLMLSLIGLTFLAGLLFWLFRRRAYAPGRWGLWILIALIPMLPFAPIRAFFAERFFYTASLGAAALCGIFFELQRRWRGAAVLWISALLIYSFRYSQAWVSDTALWSWTVQREPTNAFAHMCLAETLSQPEAAQTQYYQALVNRPSQNMTLAAWNNLAVLALAQHQPKKALYWTGKVLKYKPDAPQALYNRWRALKASGQKQRVD